MPVMCVGMGSNLFPAEMIKANNWQGITNLCITSLSIIQGLKKS